MNSNIKDQLEALVLDPSDDQFLKSEKRGSVMYITMDRPKRANCFSV